MNVPNWRWAQLGRAGSRLCQPSWRETHPNEVPYENSSSLRTFAVGIKFGIPQLRYICRTLNRFLARASDLTLRRVDVAQTLGTWVCGEPEFYNSVTFWGYSVWASEGVWGLSMASSIPRFASPVNFARPRHDGLAMVGVACFRLLASSASAQAKTTHYWSRSSTHYSAHHKSANRVHSLDRKPHSVPSQLAPEVVGKPSGRAALSANKELDQLERASVVKP